MINKIQNIVFVGDPCFPNGGAMTKRWRYLVDFLNDKQIISHVLCTALETNESYNNAQSGNYGLCSYVSLSSILCKKQILTFYKKSFALLKKWKVNSGKNILIFCNQINVWELPIYYYARYLGYNTVFDIVETSYRLNGHSSLMYRTRMWLSEQITSLCFKDSSAFVISKALKEDTIKRHPKSKLCILPNSTPVISEFTKKCLDKPLKVLYSGSFSEKDGVSYLVDGVIMAKKNGIDCSLILLGKGSKSDMKVLKKIEGKSFIDYKGFVSEEELYRLMLEADVLCMTRIDSTFSSHGFPFKLSEYLASSRIVLATNVGDVCNYITNMENAIVVEPGDAKSISDALAFIVNNEKIAIDIARNGFIVMQEKFSIPVVGKKFVEFLEQL